MNGFASNYLVIGLILGSILSWLAVIGRGVAGLNSLFPPHGGPTPRVPRVATVIGWGLLAVFLVGEALIPAPAATFDPQQVLRGVHWSLAQNGLIVAVLAALLLGGKGDPRALGIAVRDGNAELRDAAFGLLLAIGPVFVILVLTDQLGLRSDDSQHEFLRLLLALNSPDVWFWVTIAAAIAAPLAEELLFRVVLQTSLEEWLTPRNSASPANGRLPAVGAIVASSLLFCAVHSYPDSLALAPLALLLGYVYSRRRSYWTVVLMHAGFNGINLLLTALSEGNGTL